MLDFEEFDPLTRVAGDAFAGAGVVFNSLQLDGSLGETTLLITDSPAVFTVSGDNHAVFQVIPFPDPVSHVGTFSEPVTRVSGWFGRIFTPEKAFVLLAFDRDGNVVDQLTLGRDELTFPPSEGFTVPAFMEVSAPEIWSFRIDGAVTMDALSFSTLAAIPLPGAGWSMLAALGAVAVFGRRRVHR